MNILFLGYWNLQDPLTTATILPHLRILTSMPQVKKLIFTNTQRLPVHNKDAEAFREAGVIYAPLYSKNLPVTHLNKFYDFVYFPGKLVQLVRMHRIDLIIARGAPAGALAWLTWKKIHIPFIVESLEPHAEYMKESGVWKRHDPRYIYQNRWEKKIQRHAEGIMPVTENYRGKLIEDGVDKNKIRAVPCAVNMASYAFDRNVRNAARHEMNIDKNAVTAIYVGKFGGIYYDEEAFQIFADAERFFPNFHMIILTGHPKKEVESKLRAHAFPIDKAVIAYVSPSEVRKYLCAADFAFSTIKAATSRKFCSPVKNGEYWANGLPIVLTEGVGDDSDIIKKEGGGALYNATKPNSLPEALNKIKEIISQKDHREKISRLARMYRSFTSTREAYTYFLSAGKGVL